MSYQFVVSGDLSVNPNILIVSIENPDDDWACFCLSTWTLTYCSCNFAHRHFSNFTDSLLLEQKEEQENVSEDQRQEDEEEDSLNNGGESFMDNRRSFHDVSCLLDQCPWKFSFFHNTTEFLFEALIKENTCISTINNQFLHFIWKKHVVYRKHSSNDDKDEVDYMETLTSCVSHPIR